jgi:hypothetical protein
MKTIKTIGVTLACIITVVLTVYAVISYIETMNIPEASARPPTADEKAGEAKKADRISVEYQMEPRIEDE